MYGLCFTQLFCSIGSVSYCSILEFLSTLGMAKPTSGCRRDDYGTGHEQAEKGLARYSRNQAAEASGRRASCRLPRGERRGLSGGLLVEFWWGVFTRQPENSKRAHWRVPALQAPPKFHEKTPREREKKSENGGVRGDKKTKFCAVRRRAVRRRQVWGGGPGQGVLRRGVRRSGEVRRRKWKKSKNQIFSKNNVQKSKKTQKGRKKKSQN